jgi:hypothetical protein
MNLLLLMALTGCSGDDAAAPAEPSATQTTVPAELLGATWQVRMAKAENRAPFEGRESWKNWFQGRRSAAMDAFVAEKDPLGRARAHAELAAAYRQATRMAAHATVQVYGADAQESDPAETSYLVGVAGALLGEATWSARLGNASASKVAGLAAQDKAWKSWAAKAVWPPDAPASSGPGAPPSDAAGSMPSAGSVPHYELPEKGTSLRVQAGDPGTLWSLSRWHEARAREAAPEASTAVDVWLAPWRLPPEPASAASDVKVPDAFLFMSPSTSSGDALLAAEVGRDGIAAVDRHAADSVYAVLLKGCMKAPSSGGASALDVDCVLDASASLGKAVEEAMQAANGGAEEGFHRLFADFARVGLLRAGDRLAAALSDSDASGRLRINALDRTSGTTWDPVFLASVAAWDAGNRNSVRAEELVHGLLSELPGLDAAQLPLDALHVRLSRNAAPGRPMH